MTDLTKLAKGQDCLLRIPGVCSGDESTVVLCHVKMIGISGYGIKSPDVFGAYGCQKCHDVADGRMPSKYSYEERRTLLLEGMLRTQYKLIQKGVLKW